MARPIKQGLDYFPFDVDFFNDEKIIAVSGEFGIKGEITTIKLLCAVYRNGYFIEWTEMLKFKLLKELPGVSPELLDQIVRRLVKWGFFDKDLFDSASILTSKGIQRRFQSISAKMHRKNIISEYCLIETAATMPKKSKTSKPDAKPAQPARKAPSQPKPTKHPIPIDESITRMLSDAAWNEPVCMRYKITPEQLRNKMANFRLHCLSIGRLDHEDVADAKRHFCTLLSQGRLDDISSSKTGTAADYSYTGGFGGKDN